MAFDGRRGGHGVGLTIVKRLSDRFQWPIEFESEPGKGTTVRVRFPNCAQVGCKTDGTPARPA